jgi:hypothetical protein
MLSSSLTKKQQYMKDYNSRPDVKDAKKLWYTLKGSKRRKKIWNIKKYADITLVYLRQRINNTRYRNKDTTLTPEELLELIPKDLRCPVFGTKFSFGSGVNQFSMSIDRIDNDKGYHKNNVVIVSMKANAMKSSATLKELYQVADFYYELEKRSA